MATTTDTINRDDAIKRIRAALKKRSGLTWSVTGGSGTAWGWIKIDAPPKRRTWRHREMPGLIGDNGLPRYEEYNSGEPDTGNMGPHDRYTLAKLLGLDERTHYQGVSVPASSAHYVEYVDRAEGREPSVVGTQYWD